MIYNEYQTLELGRVKRAEAERMAEEARLAESVAGPDPMVRIANLVVLAIAVALLFILI